MLEPYGFSIMNSEIAGNGSTFTFQRPFADKEGFHYFFLQLTSSGKIISGLSLSHKSVTSLKQKSGWLSTDEEGWLLSSVDLKYYLSARNNLSLSVNSSLLDDIYLRPDVESIQHSLQEFVQHYLEPSVFKYIAETNSLVEIDKLVNLFVPGESIYPFPDRWLVHFLSIPQQMEASLLVASLTGNPNKEILNSSYIKYIERKTRMYRIHTEAFQEYLQLSKFLSS
ncbi:hypothetical protein QNI19_06000 [Cytophagaceae bacterium DM2B3-1]|uniref:DUF3822 domain-containing protein n=2 Tax=Xanthocytophaga flava TaxID=3048013 RepID=A0ABT7CIH0_9BACT|nr:hypothetical protein [Xanthocytophaga flavus]MDJ1466478.1 hypothetical protein [Xanthocytophaga flavus]MDJ1492474.1 hypothetical protein [Xanthocytophaga flavus]